MPAPPTTGPDAIELFAPPPNGLRLNGLPFAPGHVIDIVPPVQFQITSSPSVFLSVLLRDDTLMRFASTFTLIVCRALATFLTSFLTVVFLPFVDLSIVFTIPPRLSPRAPVRRDGPSRPGPTALAFRDPCAEARAPDPVGTRSSCIPFAMRRRGTHARIARLRPAGAR